MNNRTKGVIAGIAGAALLAGGSTFALWSDTATADGGTITNGDLDIAPVTADDRWFDVSADRTDAGGTTPVTNHSGHAISNITTWRMVPGDTVELTRAFNVKLEGDNLAAKLDVSLPATSTATATPAANVSVTYQVYGLVGTTKTALTTAPVAIGTPSTIQLVAPRAGQESGSPTSTARTTLAAATATTEANLWVVVTATLPDSVTAQEGTKLTTALNTLTVSLDQIRWGADFTATAAPTPSESSGN